ncbi:MAG: hypothetical protein IJA60_02610 [Clostridia bacterium]|nr:hypothetical protein [Clostridia bacterium]
MENPNTFEDASVATQQMFTDGQAPSDNTEAPATDGTAEQTELTGEEVPVQTKEQAELDNAAQIAETAAQAAAEQQALNAQLEQALEEAKKQNEQLQSQIDELSKQNEQHVIEDALTPPVPPDIASLAFADEATIRAAQEKYTAELSEYNRKQMMQELAPTLEFAKQGMREKEKTDVIDGLSQIPELSGIRDMLPQLDKIIANNKWLAADNVPMEEKYINAYVIAKGVNGMNNPPAAPKEPGTDELMALYQNNPAFREAIEKQRLAEIKNSQQVPPFSASSGAVNAALDIKEEPTTLEEASRRTREMFGGN